MKVAQVVADSSSHINQSVKDHVSAEGMGGQLAWPALLRKLDQFSPGYTQ